MGSEEAPISTESISGGYRVAILAGMHMDHAAIEHELTQVAVASPKRVELDLAKCDFISSSGIGVLVAFYNRLKSSGGGDVFITAIQKPVLDSLKFSRLDTLFKVQPDALAAPSAS